MRDIGAFLGRIWRVSNALGDVAQLLGIVLTVSASAAVGLKLGLPWGLVVLLIAFAVAALMAGRQVESDLRTVRVKPITPEHREMLLGSGQELQNKVSQGLVGEVIAVLPFRSNFNELAKQSFAAHFPELMAELDTWNAAVENGVTTEAHSQRIFGYLMRIWVAEISWVETCPACGPI